MADKNNLGENQSELLSDMDSNNVETLGQNMFEGMFGERPDGSKSSDEVTEETVTDEVETVVDEVQADEPIDDHSDDEETVVEADETDEEVEVDDQPEGEDTTDTSEMEIVEYSELESHLLEFGGETYTAAQISSILGQEKSAGAKAREASDTLKEIEAKEAVLVEREAKLIQRNDAAQASDTMVRMQSEARQINAKIESARAEGDMYEVTMLKDRMEILGNQYKQEKHKVDLQSQELHSQQISVAETGLKERGLGHLLQDGPAAEAWTGYAHIHLTETEANATLMSPGLAEMVEKARKWDNANKKAKGKKLKTSGKTLKAGSGKPVASKQSKKETNRKARLAEGSGTQRDVDQAAANVAAFFLDD